MFRFSKKVEYAIIALQYMAAHRNEIVTVKIMSEKLGISFEFLSKTLQILMKNGLIESHQGINGGYNLVKKPEDISVTEVVRILENRTAMIDCMSDDDKYYCDRIDYCTIKDPMQQLQSKVDSLFNRTTIAELSNQL